MPHRKGTNQTVKRPLLYQPVVRAAATLTVLAFAAATVPVIAGGLIVSVIIIGVEQ